MSKGPSRDVEGRAGGKEEVIADGGRENEAAGREFWEFVIKLWEFGIKFP